MKGFNKNHWICDHDHTSPEQGGRGKIYMGTYIVVIISHFKLYWSLWQSCKDLVNYLACKIFVVNVKFSQADNNTTPPGTFPKWIKRAWQLLSLCTVPPVSRHWSCQSGESNLRAWISGDVQAGIRLRPVDSMHLAGKKGSLRWAVKL